VANPAISKNAAWIPDVATVFDAATSMFTGSVAVSLVG
jgi:hypothetical protein